MSPLPGWQVIPNGFEDHHYPTVNATLTASGEVFRVTEGPPPYPKPEGWTGMEKIGESSFRVQQLNREGGGTPGEQPTQVRLYRLVAPVGVLPHLQTGERGDLIFTAGRVFRVQQVLSGSLLWELDIICSDNLTQQNPV